MITPCKDLTKKRNILILICVLSLVSGDVAVGVVFAGKSNVNAETTTKNDVTTTRHGLKPRVLVVIRHAETRAIMELKERIRFREPKRARLHTTCRRGFILTCSLYRVVSTNSFVWFFHPATH
jgi:hypothetical protein